MYTLKRSSFKLFSLGVGLALSLSFFLPSNAHSEDITRKAQVKTSKGKTIKLTLAITFKEQEKGLSGIKKSDFKKNQGMLFFYLDDQERSFWMPDTYFDLDIFYLDKNLEILKVHRDIPHHPGRETPPAIPRVPAEHARHVLEMRADSEIAKELKPGDKLIWSSTPALWQIERDIRLEQ